MSSSTRPIVTYMWLGIGIVAISFAAIFIKMTTAPASITAMYRMLMTAVLLAPFAWSGLRAALRRMTVREKLILLVSGVALAVHFIFWIHSLFYTSVASSTLVLTLQPIFVLIGDYFVFKKHVAIRTCLFAAVVIFGTALIGWHDLHAGKTALLGDLLSLLGTAATAVYFLAGQTLRRGLSSVHYSFLVYVISGVLLAFYSLGRGHSLVDYPRSDWELFLLLTFVPTLFGHTLFNTLLKHLPASTIAISIVGEPIGATFLAFLIFRTPIPSLWYAGAVMVSVGIVLFVHSIHRASVSLNET